MKMERFSPFPSEHVAGKRILLVTATYPYGPGEAFLSAELARISRCMESIEIVPSFLQHGPAREVECASVNPAYALRRWGAMRSPRVLTAAMGGLWRYKWRDDMQHILAHSHRAENLKELMRALYRARMFETFLRERCASGPVPDLVYFYWMVPEIMGAIAMRDKTGGNFKIAARAHRTDLYEFTRRGKYFGLREGIADRIDAVYCISGHGQSYLAKRFPVLAEKCHLARLGVPDPGFLNRQPEGEGLSIVSCSFVNEVKRLDLLIDALGRMLGIAPGMRVRWTHIGDGPLFERIRRRACGMLGERAEIRFTGHLQQKQMLQLYRDSCFDVFVNVSSSEGLPVTLMEAASVGLPLVATDVGGSGEIVRPDNGVLLPADSDAETIAGTLLRFADKQWARELRMHSRRRWQQEFDAEKNHQWFARQVLALTGEVAP